MNAFGNQSKPYPMPWKMIMSFIIDIQANQKLFLMELVVRKGGDVMDANATRFILLNVHP
jgi:hypothetical protein